MTSCTSPITEEKARAIAKPWKDKSPDGLHYPFKEKRLMEELAEKCILKALEDKDGEDELRDRLYKTAALLRSISYATRSKHVRTYEYDRTVSNKEMDEESQKQYRAEKEIIWARRNPFKSYEEGENSDHYMCIDRQALYFDVVYYLENPWLRHALLDWILVDIVITNELCQFAEAFKQKSFPTRKLYTNSCEEYFMCKGNLSEMKKFKISKFDSEDFKNKVCIWIGIPVLAIYLAIHFEYEITSVVLITGYALIILLYVLYKTMTFTQGVINFFLKTKSFESSYKLWSNMAQVWRILTPPLVNPTEVKKAMTQSSDQGAAWDNLAWCLIDRVIEIDPAIWIPKWEREIPCDDIIIPT